MKQKPFAVLWNIVMGFLKVIFNRHTIFPWLLAGISVFISWRSFAPNTWLSGWDTLHPEFNFGLAFERLFFGVFRSEQGLGAVAAHSHMADLPRVALLAFASLIVPASFLRYLFISLCLLAGALGSFVFIRGIVLRETKNSNIFAFLGALFYLLNLGTLQQFYVPFEMFTVQFAALPWLFYFASRYLLDQRKRDLVLFGVVTVLSAPMAFASVLWFVYFLSFLLYLLFFLKKRLKKVVVLASLTLALNSFWLLPAFYFVSSGNASLVQSAKVNKIFSQEAFAYNRTYGTFSDILLLRNFLLDWLAYDSHQGSFTYLFDNWREHLSQQGILQIGYVLSGVSLAGLFFGVIYRHKIGLAFVLPMVFAGIFLVNQNPPFDGLFTLLREKLPLFGEAMRFPFTKFSLIFGFGFSCFFALGQRYLQVVFRYKTLQLILFSVLFFIYMKPAFTGDFISKKIQVAIPQEYFEMFRWFDKERFGRIATFPVNSFWGWTYYKWGFQGAQFISFGIKQPLMDRDYDRWNPDNEEYFRQISHAVYSQDISLLEKVLEKYKINYLILDRNIISPGEDKKALFNDEIQSLFAGSVRITPAAKFGEISVYRFKPDPDNGFSVSTPPSFAAVTEAKGPQEVDLVYRDFGDYFVSGKNPSLYLPFRSLTDNQNILRADLVKKNGQQLQFLIGKSTESLLPWDTYLKNELTVPAQLYTKRNNGSLTVKLVPKIFQVTKEQDRVNLFYQIQIPKQSKNDLLVSLDNYQTVAIKATEEGADFIDHGTVYLSTAGFNNMSFYPVESEKEEKDWDISDVLVSEPVGICSLPGSDQEAGITFLKRDGVTLAARNVRSCVRIPFSRIFKETGSVNYKSLVHISFRIDSPDQALGNYCIFDKTVNRCIKERDFLSEGLVSDYISVDPVSIGNMELVFFLDGINKEQKISYTDLSFTINNPAAFSSVAADDLYRAFSGLNLNIRNDNNFQIGDLSEYHEESFNLLTHDKRAYSCTPVLPKKLTRIVSQTDGFIEYSSEAGSSCDFFSFPNLPHNLGYVIAVGNENIAGLPLKLCVANNLTKRCDLSVALPENKTPDTTLFLLPPVNDGGVGYNIHFDNYSTGRIISTNRIRQLKIIPFPYYWINKMEFTGGRSDIISSSDFQIKSAKEIFPGVFTVIFSGQGKQGLIVLDRSFDRGWFGSSGEHVKVNGWANGWLTEGGGQKRMIIFFWPQILEFFGLAMAGTIFLILFKLLLTKRLKYG